MALYHVIGLFLTCAVMCSARVLSDDMDSFFDDAFTEQEVVPSRRVARAAPGAIALISMMFEAGNENHDAELDLNEFWGTFNAFDGNGDHRITPREYRDFFTTAPLPGMEGINKRALPRIASMLFNAGDMNGDRVIDMRDAAIIFSNFDTNLDDVVSFDEYMGRWSMVLRRIHL